MESAVKKYPIGVFDSGYGGLTVLKEMLIVLPNYDFIYLGDNARAPYGPLSFETVYEYTLECVKWFFAQGCPLVILACNTASAKALRSIQQLDLPKLDTTKRVLGVIRPTAEIISTFSKTNHVGIMATQGTVQSQSYVLEINKFSNETQVSQQACPSWVQLVENGLHQSTDADEPVKNEIDNLLVQDSEIDTILLACTHYPLLIDKIKQFVPDNIKIISQGKIVADSLVTYLNNHPEINEKCSKTSNTFFYTTGNETNFNEHATNFFGEEINALQIKL